jgi:hypothetical protein
MREAFRLDHRGWKAAPTRKISNFLGSGKGINSKGDPFSP